MSVEAPGTERSAAIPGYQVTAALPRRRNEGARYEATTEDGRQVELWVVPARDAQFASRFLEDAAALASLEHAPVPRIVDAGEHEDSVYVATEPSNGTTLEALLEAGPGIAPMRAIRLLGEAADALDAAHRSGVCHGGITTASVIAEGHTVERVLLRDFALGHEGSAEEDIRALAAVLFECFTGSAPSGVPASEVRPQLPADLDAVLARGLSDDPRERPGSGAQLVAEAARTLMAATLAARTEPSSDAETAPAPETAPVPARTQRVPLRRRLAAATVPFALAVLVVGGAAVGGWIVGKPEAAADAPKKVSSGTVELGLPAGWRQTHPPRRLGGLGLDAALAGAGASGGRIEAGTVSGTLPSRVAGRVARKPGRPEAVRLGDLQAYRWRGVEERGSGTPITLFAAGTDGGIVTLSCQGPAAAIARCENAAGSLAVPASVPAVLSDLGSWTTRIDGTTSRLARRRKRDRAKLRAARTPRGRASIARGLASDYSAARRSLTARRAPIGAASAQARLKRSLSGIAASYRSLAGAARRQQTARYAAAGRSISRRERELTRLLRGL